MKHAGIIICLLLALLTVPAFAGDLDPILNKDVPVFIETPLPVIVDVIYTEKLTRTTTIIDTFLELIGWKQTSVEIIKNEITVEIDGMVVGIIPNDSKFAGMEIHDICIPHQYGTDLWYGCEVSL